MNIALEYWKKFNLWVSLQFLKVESELAVALAVLLFGFISLFGLLTPFSILVIIFYLNRAAWQFYTHNEKNGPVA